MTARQEFQVIGEMLADEDMSYAVWLLKTNFGLRRKSISWDDIEEIDPDEDDFTLDEKIRARIDGYGEYITESELMHNLGLRG